MHEEPVFIVEWWPDHGAEQVLAEDEPPRVAPQLLIIAGEQAIVFGELPNVIEEPMKPTEEPMNVIEEPMKPNDERMNVFEEPVNVVDQLLFADVRRLNPSVGRVCFEEKG